MMLSVDSFVHRTGYYAPVSNSKLLTAVTWLDLFFLIVRSITCSDFAAAMSTPSLILSLPGPRLQFTMTVICMSAAAIIAQV